jgi:hypothetical protein
MLILLAAEAVDQKKINWLRYNYMLKNRAYIE